MGGRGPALGLPDQSVFTSTFLDRRQQMYVGTTAGLFRYREIDQRFEGVEPLSVDTSDVPRSVPFRNTR